MLAHLLLGPMNDEAALALGEKLAQAMQPGEAGAGAHPAQRLVRAVEALNRAQYEARWEPRPDAPQLILGHCPYWQVIAEHPWLCQMDATMLEALTGASVEQTARLADDGKQGQRCIFHLKKA
jgi:predicted ArsR family transcriptional regulator